MQTSDTDPAWRRERQRLNGWVLECIAKSKELQHAVRVRDLDEKRRLMAWFDANGVDSLAGY